MSSNGMDLLRMLEPTVRPTGAGPTSRRGGGVPPIEDRDFEQMLEDVQSAAEVGGEEAKEPPTADPLAPLTGPGTIECASLRTLIAGLQDAA